MNDLARLIQGTPEWLQARCGSLGASDIYRALTRDRTQKGWGLTREGLRTRLATERLIGKPIDGYKNDDMVLGQEREPAARDAYCWERAIDVEQVGLILHPKIKWTHASPDGYVCDDGLVELKCPRAETHYGILKGAPPEPRYLLQCCWQMACTGRAWVDLCSYNPDFKPGQQLLIVRVLRDEKAITQTEQFVEEFLAEVEAELETVNRRHPAENTTL